jgi:hypothetical protein
VEEDKQINRESKRRTWRRMMYKQISRESKEAEDEI